MTELQIMAELTDILDELNKLPDTAIAERAGLRTRQHQLRSELASLQAAERAALAEEWAAQAAAKTEKEPGFAPGFTTEASGGAGDSGGGAV